MDLSQKDIVDAVSHLGEVEQGCLKTRILLRLLPVYFRNPYVRNPDFARFIRAFFRLTYVSWGASFLSRPQGTQSEQVLHDALRDQISKVPGVSAGGLGVVASSWEAYVSALREEWVFLHQDEDQTRSDEDLLWGNLVYDIQCLQQGFKVQDVLDLPLWDHDRPRRVMQNQGFMSLFLLSQGEDWLFWTAWYEDRLKGNVHANGKRFDEVFYTEVLKISEDMWADKPEVVNGYLRSLEDRRKRGFCVV